MKIDIDQFNEELAAMLEEYGQSITSDVKKKTKEAMNMLVKETKETININTGKTKIAVSSRTKSETERQITKEWYVKNPRHRVIHLIENPHQLRNGGRTQGSQFIKKATDKTVKWYTISLEEVIHNAGH